MLSVTAGRRRHEESQTIVGVGAFTNGFSKDGLCRIPSLDLKLYQSPHPTDVVSAWGELIHAADFDPVIASGAAFK